MSPSEDSAIFCSVVAQSFAGLGLQLIAVEEKDIKPILLSMADHGTVSDLTVLSFEPSSLTN